MNKIEAQQLIQEMQQLANGAQNKPVLQETETQLESFGNLFAEQLNKVNQASQETASLQDKFVLGDPDVTLPQVMIASQKSSLYTQFLVEARNKMISAYNEIMNMSV